MEYGWKRSKYCHDCRICNYDLAIICIKEFSKKSEQAIREVLDDKEYEKLKHILEATENQLKEVSSLLITVDKQGVNQNQ